MNRFFGILLIGLITTCGNVESPFITDTEVDAVESVLSFYGGICNRSKGFEMKNGVTETYFELKMSRSELIESYIEVLEMPASNVAYLFYSNLKDEKENYTHIKVIIQLPDNELEEFYYSVKDLNEISKLTNTLHHLSDNIKSNDYDRLLSLFDDDIAVNMTNLQIEKYCAPYDSLYGKIIRTEFQGFRFFKDETSNTPLVHLAGIMLREKDNTPISIYINRNSKKISTLKYEF